MRPAPLLILVAALIAMSAPAGAFCLEGLNCDPYEEPVESDEDCLDETSDAIAELEEVVSEQRYAIARLEERLERARHQNLMLLGRLKDQQARIEAYESTPEFKMAEARRAAELVTRAKQRRAERQSAGHTTASPEPD